jgi:hypothetical protein
VDDVYALDSLTKDDMLRYQQEHMAEVEQRLLGELAKDVETSAEKRAAALQDYASEIAIKGRQTEREMRLKSQLDKDAEKPSVTRNLYAPLVTFLEGNIADNILFEEEADTATELQKVLGKIGFTVGQAVWGKDAISIKNSDGKEVVINIPKGIEQDAELKKSFRDQVIQAVFNNIPGENEVDKLMYLNSLYSSERVPQEGDLNP